MKSIHVEHNVGLYSDDIPLVILNSSIISSVGPYFSVGKFKIFNRSLCVAY